MEKSPLVPVRTSSFLLLPHRWPVRICCSPAQLASNLQSARVEPAMSSGCNVEVSPQACAVELAAMKVRFIYLTEQLAWHFGKLESLNQSKPLCGPVVEKQKTLSFSCFLHSPQVHCELISPLFLHKVKHEWGKHYMGFLSLGEVRWDGW